MPLPFLGNRTPFVYGVAAALIAAVVLTPLAAFGSQSDEPSSALVFEKDVAPIFIAHCNKCHKGNEPKGGLDLTTAAGLMKGGDSGPALLVGSADMSLLFQKVQDKLMPPPEDKNPLGERQIVLIRKWIEGGAKTAKHERIVRASSGLEIKSKDRDFWPFRPPVAVALPTIRDAARVRTSIDAFVLARLEQQGLSFSQDATRQTLLRRAQLDLLGLPPTPEEVGAFLQDARPDAYERLIDRLLDRPEYGERWGRHWLDAAGYTDAPHCDETGALLPIDDWLYRDYVVQAFNRDKPYDRFLTEQLAGDEIVPWRTATKYTPEIVEALTATGYLRTVPDWTHSDKNMIYPKYRFDVLSRVVDHVGSGILGLTMGCARCHSHKYDPIPHQDYYRMTAVFATAYNLEHWKCPIDRYLPDVSKRDQDDIARHNAAIDRRIAQNAKRIAELQDPRQRRSAAERKAARLALEREIAHWKSSKRSFHKIQALYDIGAPPTVRQLLRGDPDTPGPAVQAGFISVLCPAGKSAAVRPTDTPDHSSGRRLALARWLTNRQHPLTARVMVNRIWQHHFGKGIVATPDNFGHSGVAPTHPELLDWLAVDFMEHGWKIKRLHKLLMTSTTYRQAAYQSPATAAATVDPDNDLLSRMNLRRLEAESIRDSVLAVSGKLNRAMGGPPIPVEQRPDGLVLVKSTSTPTSQWRRSLYLMSQRGSHASGKGFMLSLFEIFDFPEIVINCTRRSNSTTPLQSLALINSDFMTEQAGYFAERVKRTAGKKATRESQIQCAFLLALGREPSPEESGLCLNYLRAQSDIFVKDNATSIDAAQRALTSLCLMLLASNEFLYID